MVARTRGIREPQSGYRYFTLLMVAVREDVTVIEQKLCRYVVVNIQISPRKVMTRTVRMPIGAKGAFGLQVPATGASSRIFLIWLEDIIPIAEAQRRGLFLDSSC